MQEKQKNKGKMLYCAFVYFEKKHLIDSTYVLCIIFFFKIYKDD